MLDPLYPSLLSGNLDVHPCSSLAAGYTPAHSEPLCIWQPSNCSPAQANLPGVLRPGAQWGSSVVKFGVGGMYQAMRMMGLEPGETMLLCIVLLQWTSAACAIPCCCQFCVFQLFLMARQRDA